MTTLATAATVWHTAPYVYSHIMAREGYTGEEGFGDLIEYRLRAEIIAPRRGTAAPGDRPYVGAVPMGAHTHFGVTPGTMIMTLDGTKDVASLFEGNHV